MRRFPSASALIGATKPDIPIIGLGPHATAHAARRLLQHFSGDVAGAPKADGSLFLFRHVDAASLPETEDAATIPGASFHCMRPVKSRAAVCRALS